MKINSKRKVNRYMSFYRNQYGFRSPYQVLVDGTFCMAALENQVRVAEQISKYLQDDLKILTTQCVILEMEKLGPSIRGALVICKQFAVHKCGHEKKPVPGSKCLESMIADNNPSRYIIATQDPGMRQVARGIPGTPVLYLHCRSPTLEGPSHQSNGLAKVNTRMLGEDHALYRLREIKKKELGVPPTQVKKIKKKKAKSRNPLSCRRKIKKAPCIPSNTGSSNGTSDQQPRKKRKRVKISAHVRQELISKLNQSNS